MHLVEWDGRRGHGDPLPLPLVEVGGPAAGPLQQPRHGAGVDVADVGRGRDRAPMPQALDDADDGRFGELGGPQEGPLALAEARAAGGAVQAADVLGLADPFDHAEVAGAEAVEVAAVGVGAGQAGQSRIGSAGRPPW
jgi:hypothetical protein